MRDKQEMRKRQHAEVVVCGAPYDQRLRPSGHYWVGPEARQVAVNEVWPAYRNAVSPPEAGAYDEGKRLSKYACPACDGILPQEMDAAPRPGFVCRFCHFQLWCRRRVSKDVVELEALPGPAPESWEVTRVVGTLKRSDMPDRATLDLSRFEIMSSSWLATLIRFKKVLQVSGCTLVLSGLRPYIYEVFDRMHLETYFEIRGFANRAEHRATTQLRDGACS